MPNTYEITAEQVASVCPDNIRQTAIDVGPKEVRTPNMTVVAHDLMQVNKIHQQCRAETMIPSLHLLPGCSTAPKPGKYKRTNSCDCE